MSFFTEEREHLVERALNIVVRFFPMAIFGLSFPQNARVFGTFHARYDDYPTTGIHTCIPYEQETERRNPLVTFWRQFIYPLRLMLGYQPTKVMPDDTLSPT